MKIVIFAGGIGKRLWPLSRKDSPKQFKPLFGEETTLENSFNSIKEKFSVKDIFVSTGEQFIEHVFEVLPSLPRENIIVEPESRDTGAAVAYAMLKIAQKFPNEPVVIRWQNSLIKNTTGFIQALEVADNLFSSKQAEFVYLGVPSKYPNTSVGYIALGSKVSDAPNVEGVFDFDGFREKPNEQLAEEYQKAGTYAWNPGCYITTPNFVLSQLKSKSPECYSLIEQIQNSLGQDFEWETTKDVFSKMEKISIDVLLWEKLDSNGIKVVLKDYDWHYVSTWAQLRKAVALDDKPITKGNVKTLNTKNSLIYNYDQSKIVTTIGLDCIDVIVTEDAILILNEENAADVKEMHKKLEEEGLAKYL